MKQQMRQRIKKSLSHLVGFMLITLSIAACDQSEPQQHTAEQEQQALLETVTAFNNAFQAGDVDQLQSMITDNYQHTNGTAQAIGKTTWINYLKRRQQEIASGELIVNSYEMQDTKIEMYDKVGIITARIVVSSTRSGQEQENEYRVTNIWVKDQGVWKRAGFHDGKIL